MLLVADRVAAGSVDGVASANVGGSGVGSDGLDGSSDGGVGDVGSTEVVHGGGVRPEGVDGGIVVVGALVAAAHAEGNRGIRVGQPGLSNIGAGDVGGTWCMNEESWDVLQCTLTKVHAISVVARANSAGVASNAGGEGLKVNDVVEHF